MAQKRCGQGKVNILLIMALTHLSTGGGPGAVQECGGRAQCYALLLTVYSTGGGQPSTVQVIEGLAVENVQLLATEPIFESVWQLWTQLFGQSNEYMISFLYMKVHLFPPVTPAPSSRCKRHFLDPYRGGHNWGLQHLLP